jgi:uncharacterized protein
MSAIIAARETAGRALARLAPALALCLVWIAVALGAPSYPELTGRVVDAAGIIPAETRAAIERKLIDLETKSGIQFVVASVPSLDGGDVETYANGLFRHWKLGEAKKNNGALLLVAPNERKVRIEVGYGLEGTLTDALSKVIIVNAIAPRFKAGDFGGGVSRGVDDVITVLTTDASEWQKKPQVRDDTAEFIDQIVPIIIFLIFVFVFISIVRSSRSGPGGGLRGGGGRGGSIVFLPGPSSSGGGWSGGGGWGGGGGGGFSGGGGSSGGGGASGDW